MKKDLILVISDRMDDNRKSNRYEDKLIRMGESARKNLGLADDKSVELWPEGSSIDRINRSKLLRIFHAYSFDLKQLKQSHIDEREHLRVGFVTTKTFNYICGNRGSKKGQKDIWISDTIEDTVLGADPEFVLMTPDNSIQYAGHVEGFGFEGELGSDGPWAEVRPEPTINVKDFIYNIKKIFKDHPKTEIIKPYDWVGGCFYNNRDSRSDENRSWPIGGHIHIGIPAMLYKFLEEERDEDRYYMGSTYSCLAKVVDEYITIPMMRVEGIDNSTKRRKEYGKFGDFRSNHTGRIECRTPSGEWMIHPELTKAVIGSVKAVSRAFFKILEENGFKKNTTMTEKMESQGYRCIFSANSGDSNEWKNIKSMQAMKTIKSSKEMNDILQLGKIKFDQNYFNKLKSMFKSLSTYKSHSEYIDRFLDITKLSKDDLEKIDRNLKHTWISGKKFIVQ